MDGDVAITIQQISPVIAHAYEESSLPCSVFLVDVHNKCSDPINVTVLLTFQVVENRYVPRHGAENVGLTIWTCQPPCPPFLDLALYSLLRISCLIVSVQREDDSSSHAGCFPRSNCKSKRVFNGQSRAQVVSAQDSIAAVEVACPGMRDRHTPLNPASRVGRGDNSKTNKQTSKIEREDQKCCMMRVLKVAHEYDLVMQEISL